MARLIVAALAAIFAVATAGSIAQAQIVTVTKTITQADGAYTVEKIVSVFADTDPLNPAPLAGNFTYVYTLANLPGSFLCLVGFDLEVPPDNAAAPTTVASFIDGPGINPSAVLVGAVNNVVTVEWDFNSPQLCPAQISDRLIVQSPFAPGNVTQNMVSVDGVFFIDTPSTCVGPFVLANGETPGEPNACTIGFWKNRAAGKQGTLQHFPDDPNNPVEDDAFNAIVTQAVALCAPTFANEADLLNFLASKGKRDIETRGKQQLAAVCLDLAAGDLFAGNMKCELFEGNCVIDNACNPDGLPLSIGDALTQMIASLQSGDNALFHDAQECADDINNGIGIGQECPAP